MFATVVGLLGLVLCTHAGAADESGSTYFGDLFSRSTLTGDWGGARNDLAKKGITFDVSVTQIGQGVVDGGTGSTWQYGGRGDLTFHLDTQKLGLWPGGFLTTELEGNWNKSVNGETGALMPVNANQLFPLPLNDNVALPELSFAQFLCRYAGVLVGKIDTMTSGDVNEFAHGKGDTQFVNLAFNINPVALTIPYSTLAAGAILLPTADPKEAIVNLVVLSATGKASTTGFDDLNGAVFSGSGRLRTTLFGLTGHQLVGAFYSNRRYTSIDQRLGLVATDRIAPRSGTWAVYYNFDQFLYETAKFSEKGIGLFGRFGASEGDPNPVQYFYSGGIGAKGLIPCRDYDQFGVGYYYSSISNPTLQIARSTRSILQDEWGFEAYYNVAVTRWLLVTPDIQVIGGAQRQEILGPRDRRFVDNATVVGFRGQVVF